MIAKWYLTNILDNLKYLIHGVVISGIPLFLFGSCQWASKKPDADWLDKSQAQKTVRYIEGKLFIHDKVNKKNYSMDLEAFLIPSRWLRLEAAGPLASRIASLIVTENRIETLLYREKKFLAGDFPRVWLRSNPTLNVISVPFSPSQLQALLLGERLPEKEWSCQDLDSPNEKTCHFITAEESLKKVLSWKKSDQGKTVVLAESERAQLRLEIKSSVSIQAKAELFSLKKFPQYEFVDITPR